jgi:hypothetical protein
VEAAGVHQQAATVSVIQPGEESDDFEMPRYKRRKRDPLPYGIWTLIDGTEVLYDREYQPRWRRKGKGEPAVAMKPYWIDDIAKKEWLYDPTPGPLNSAEMKRLLEIEKEFVAGKEIVPLVRPVPVVRRALCRRDADGVRQSHRRMLREYHNPCAVGGRFEVINGGKSGKDE